MHTLHTPLVPSPRMLKACALFGVSLARSTRRLPDPALVALARDIDKSLGVRSVCVIQGSSGSGKSTLLTLLERRLRVRGVRVRRPCALLDHASLLDQSAAPLEVTIDALAAAGITEPALLVRPPSALSEGQRHRALLAITLLRLSRASPHRPTPRRTAASTSSHLKASATPTTLLIDEFTSTLDPIWAAAVARALPHLLARLNVPVRVVVATSRPDLEIPESTRVQLPDLAPAA